MMVTKWLMVTIFLCLQLMHNIFNNVKYMGSILISLLNIVKPFNCIIVLMCAQILTRTIIRLAAC